MAKDRVLITGGAGFIGSHLADELLAAGYRVRVLDRLDEQVHPRRRPPDYLDPEVELHRGDVRDVAAVRRALEGVSAVFHFAAAVGVGQSMYAIRHYTSVNSLGTAVLLEALVERPVDRLIVASSMSAYGEGLYEAPDGRRARGLRRTPAQLAAGRWELETPEGQPLRPLPTPETQPLELASVYALGKADQERMCLMIGDTYGIPTRALRFFNVYGPRQALSNPYTGVLAIFASRYLNDRPPLIFEDGEQLRDFVSVHDVARACRLALEVDDTSHRVFNVGSGQPRTVTQVARAMGRALGKESLAPEVTREYRQGDIRHCFADIGRARSELGYAPRVAFDDGLRELADWLEGQRADDRVQDARRELASRGLTIGRTRRWARAG